MMPPRSLLAAVFAFSILPQSYEPKMRLTRGSPVTAFTRTSQKTAP